MIEHMTDSFQVALIFSCQFIGWFSSEITMAVEFEI